MANRQLGGFRWSRSKTAPNSHSPPIEMKVVATSYGTKLAIGDPVKILNDGTIAICAAGDSCYGVFDGAEQYFDGTVIRRGGSLPATTVWGSTWERRSVARVIPAQDQIFQVCADDATTATTPAAFLAFIGENCELVAGTSVNDTSGYLLDISTHATTNTLSWTIEGLVNPNLTDFASIYVPLEVRVNLLQDISAGSATGV